jgi:plastocyanin
MIRQIKLTLLAAAFAIIAVSAQADTYSGDLVIGFSDGTHNDVVYDLGPESSITNGQTWKFGSTGLNIITNLVLANTHWGVIGDNTTTHSVWCSTDGTFIPRELSGHSDLIQNVEDPTENLYNNNMSPAAAGSYFLIDPNDIAGESWNHQMVTAHAVSGAYALLYEDPNILGAGSDFFYGLTGYNTDPVLLGSFTLAANFVVTYNTNSVSSSSPPTAGFSGSPTNIFVTQSVVFTNTSTSTGSSITSWAWNFGNGTLNTGSGTNVTVTYNSPGTYNVQLIVSSADGSGTNTQNGYIVVYPKPSMGRPVLSGTNVIFGGTNGVPFAQYRIYSSTNVVLPFTNSWTVVFTGAFDANGNYSYTNSPPTNRATFFRLVSP